MKIKQITHKKKQATAEHTAKRTSEGKTVPQNPHTQP